MKIQFTAILLFSSLLITGQNIWEFTSIQPQNKSSQFKFPDGTHTFQYIIEQGDNASGGNVPNNFDFTGYVPIGGSSINGYLSINSEVSSPGGVTIMDLQFNPATSLWVVTNPTIVSFSGVGGTSRNCSGGVTPWGTVLTAEESESSPYGWIVELNPITKSVMGKRWGLGNYNHENASIHPNSNNRVVYSGRDNSSGFVTKFIADNPADLTAGKLYVLGVNSGANSGSWHEITAPAGLADHGLTVSEVSSLQSTEGFTYFSGVEDVEAEDFNISGGHWIYFTAKGDEAVYRFRELNDNPLNTTGVVDFEVFVGRETAFNGGSGNQFYTIDYGTGTQSVLWGDNDNLAIDNNGNLWVQMDGDSQDEIYMIDKTHTQTSPKVNLFGIAPSGSESTGMTFSPDNKYMFLSIQHPSGSNIANQTDASGITRDFDNDVAIVVALKTDLGPASLAVELSRWDATMFGQQVKLEWMTYSETNNSFFTIQRQSQSNDNWEDIGQVLGAGNSVEQKDYVFIDQSPIDGINYYRLKQTDFDGTFTTTNIISIKNIKRDELIRTFPNPVVNYVTVQLTPSPSPRTLFIRNYNGQVLKKRVLNANQNQMEFETSDLSSGTYQLDSSEGHSIKFVVIR